jgi:hypothetical protein
MRRVIGKRSKRRFRICNLFRVVRSEAKHTAIPATDTLQPAGVYGATAGM